MATVIPTTPTVPSDPIARPPTPRPTSDFHIPNKRTSYYSLRSPVLMSPVRVRPFSSFQPKSCLTSPVSPGWPDINIISPSTASHRSFYSDRDGSASDGFQSPRLALQTSNLFGWHGRHTSEEYTPISATEICTPISPSASAEEDLHSPRLELLTSNPLSSNLLGDPEAPYTPISPSASDDPDIDDQMWDITTDDMFQSLHDPQETYTPISPSISLRQGELIYTHFAIPTLNDLPWIDTQYRFEPMYSPISPSSSVGYGDQKYTEKLALQIHDLKAAHSAEIHTPISASESIQRGWKEMIYDVATPAARFFIPDFQDGLTPIVPSGLEAKKVSMDSDSLSNELAVTAPAQAEDLKTIDEARKEDNIVEDDERSSIKDVSSPVGPPAPPSIPILRLTAAHVDDSELIPKEKVYTPKQQRHSMHFPIEHIKRETTQLLSSGKYIEKTEKETTSPTDSLNIEPATAAPAFKEDMFDSSEFLDESISYPETLNQTTPSTPEPEIPEQTTTPLPLDIEPCTATPILPSLPEPQTQHLSKDSKETDAPDTSILPQSAAQTT